MIGALNAGFETTDKRSEGAALGDVRILDMTRVWAGPLGERIFADFGAHVIKISDPRAATIGLNPVDRELNRNKPNLALRLDTDAGRAIFLDLVSLSDVVVENFRPRVMRNLNLDYDSLRAANPAIIMCSMPGYGASGPYSDFPSLGMAAESISGIDSIIGYSDERPLPSGIAYADPLSALNQVAAVMNALAHKRATGRGQFIDLALADSPVCVIGEFIAANSVSGYQPLPSGNRHPVHAPNRAYRALGDDSWVAISVTSDDEWRALCATMGRPDLLGAPAYGTADARKRNEDEIDRVVTEWVRHRDAFEVMVLLQEAGVPAGRVANNREFLADPHLNERGFFVELQEPEHGSKRYPGQAIPGNYVSEREWKPASNIGQDSDEILANLLGYGERRRRALHDNGVIGSRTP